ncbi:MAG: M50 family metallopeptidase [Streptosporangiaceae bacterium]
MDAIGVVIFVVALLFSVMLHETGHFVLARKFGMKVTRYFVGFGPTIWSTWRGDTEYGIKALPFGGFVKIVGMHSMDDPDDPEDEPQAFRNKPAWQRILVLLAGSAMHFIIALVLVFGLALAVGIASDNVTQLGTISACVPASVSAYDNGTCTPSDPASPAKLAGLRVGDTVTAFDGHPVSNFTQLGDAIRAVPPGSSATITVRRDGKLVTLPIKPASVNGRNGSYLGIGPAVLFQVASPLGAIEYSGSTFGQVLVGSAQAVTALPRELPKLFDKQPENPSGGQLIGVVGAAEATGTEVASNDGWQYKVSFVLLLIASLNIFVGAFNLLPLLPLDGGHIAVIIYERIRAWLARLRGRPDPGLADMAKFLPVSFSVFIVLIVFSLALVAANILNPVNLTGG